jgi:hypothetical protein
MEEFRSLVLGDPTLQQALDAVSDDAGFAALASRLARERGIELSDSDLLLAVGHARRNWLLRIPE